LAPRRDLGLTPAAAIEKPVAARKTGPCRNGRDTGLTGKVAAIATAASRDPKKTKGMKRHGT